MRAGTFFTLDVYEAAAVADALRTKCAELRKQVDHPSNTPLITQRFQHQLDHCEEIQERLRRRFAKARIGLEGIMEAANAR